MLYKILSQRNPEHNQELIKKLRVLYEGGYAVQENAQKFLTKAPREQQEYYEFRCQQAAYMPYFGQLVDYIVGALFQNELQVLPAGDAENPDTPGELPDADFYPMFAADADRKGTTFAQVIRESMTEALVCHCAWVAIDMPPAVEAETRAEEDAAGGARGYCCPVPYEQIFDFAEDEDGSLRWAILGKRVQERATPDAARDTYVDRFTVWTRDEKTGKVSFEVFQTEPIKVGTEPKADYDVPSIGGGNTTFKKIPFERTELPKGLWAGNKIGPMAEEHYRRRSDLIGAEARSLVEIPYVKLGPQTGAVGDALPADIAEDQTRGNDVAAKLAAKGNVVLAEKDEIGFASPTGAAYEIVDKQLHDLRDEIFRSVHAMALSLANTGAAVGRSGESKREDRSATEIVLEYLGSLARDLAVRIYTTISEARNEDVKWVAHGLDSFDLDDRTDLITEATQIELLTIPSKTWKTEYKTHLALATVPGCSPETKAQIQKEIADGIDEAEELEAAKKLAGQFGADGDPTDPNAPAPPAGKPKTPGGGRAAQPPPDAPPPPSGG